MNELYELLKRIKEEKGIDTKIIISLEDGELKFNDVCNVKDKQSGLCSIGGGALVDGDMDIKFKFIVKCIENNILGTDDELNNFDDYIDTDSIGCFDMSIETMSKNNFGAVEK